MQREPHQSVWDWYRQFSHGPADEDQRSSRNFFRRTTQEELNIFKDEFGPILPEAYEKFLLEIGAGYLKQDANSKITISQYNEFLSLEYISLILQGKSIEGEVSASIIVEGEFPFFLEFSDSIFVIDINTMNVHYPYVSEMKYANSFDEFLSKLMADCEFYTYLKF